MPITGPTLIINPEHETNRKPPKINVVQLQHKQTRLFLETPTRVVQHLQHKNKQMRK